MNNVLDKITAEYPLSLLVRLMEFLDKVEESDGGKLFHPTMIHSCRVLEVPKLNALMGEIKAVVERSKKNLNKENK